MGGAVSLAFIILALLIGGSALFAPLATAIVQVGAVALLSFIVLRPGEARNGEPVSRWAWGVPGLALAVMLSQLLPIPPALWSAMPGRGLIAAALEARGAESGWRPTSLYPALTRSALLTLLVPVTIFAATLRMSERNQSRAMTAIVLAAIVSTLLGIAQSTGPDAGALFLFPGGLATEPSGLFSNRNHQVTLLATAIPLTVALACRTTMRSGLAPTIGALLITLLAVGAVLTRSRSFLILVPAAAMLSALWVWPRQRSAHSRFPRSVAAAIAIAIGLATLGVALVLNVGADRLVARLGAPDGRSNLWPDLMWTVWHYFPVGSGFGSFVPIFASAESLAAVGPTYVNHAHNEYLQVAIEGGLPGIAIVAVFLVWFSIRTIGVMRESRDDPAVLGGRAAAIAIAIMLVHSLVDYPLRTLSIASVFAVSCAILEAARPRRAKPS